VSLHHAGSRMAQRQMLAEEQAKLVYRHADEPTRTAVGDWAYRRSVVHYQSVGRRPTVNVALTAKDELEKKMGGADILINKCTV